MYMYHSSVRFVTPSHFPVLAFFATLVCHFQLSRTGYASEATPRSMTSSTGTSEADDGNLASISKAPPVGPVACMGSCECTDNGHKALAYARYRAIILNFTASLVSRGFQ